MEEIQNISNMPDKVFKHFFTKKDRNIVNRVKECASSTCHEKISPSYINVSLNNFKRGIVYFSKGDVVGFVVWKEKTEEMPNSMKMLASMAIERINFKPDTFMEISLLCAKMNTNRLGSHILYDINQYCLDNSIHLIELYPATADLIQFYHKNGFKINSTRLPRTNIYQPRMYKIVDHIRIKKTNKTRRQRQNPIVSKMTPARKIEYYNTLLHEQLQNEHNYTILDNIFIPPNTE